jgi:uncharacterized protein YutE (UPF0331/DUF86 family)
LVDRYIVQARIAKIREYIALLRKIHRQTNEATFVKDPLIYGNAERYLQLATQCVLDVSNHVVADMRLNLPSDNHELFSMLTKHKVISTALSRKLTAMAGFRNILVHEYLEIDRHRVYSALENDLPDFEKFIRAISKLI